MAGLVLPFVVEKRRGASAECPEQQNQTAELENAND